MTINKIQVGLCAYGMSGRVFHAPFLQAHHAFELKAVVERTKNVAVDDYPDIFQYRNVKDLVEDPTLDLIIVNTPVQLHFAHTMLALENNKHVVVEKPFCINDEEARAMIDLATQKGCLLSVYQNRRWDRDFKQVQKILHQGVLGDVHEVEIRFDRFRTTASGKLHKEGAMPGAGALYDIGAHLADQALQLFGKPEAVFADIHTIKKDVVADDYFEILLYYSDHLRVRLISSTMAKEPTAGYVLHGNQGSFIQKRSDSQESLLTQGIHPMSSGYQPELGSPDGLLHLHAVENGQRQHLHSSPTSYYDYYNELAAALHQKTSNPVSGQDGFLTIQLLLKAIQSSKEKRVIPLD